MSMILGIFSCYVKITVHFVKGLVHVPTLSIFTSNLQEQCLGLVHHCDSKVHILYLMRIKDKLQ